MNAMPTLVLSEIGKTLLSEFPELKEPVEKTFGSYYDLKSELPEAYPIFEDALQGLLFKLLDAGKNDFLLTRIFLFLERMADSQDIQVVNLLWIGILEPLVYHRERIRRAWPYMGDGTRALAGEIARRRGWQENIPSG